MYSGFFLSFFTVCDISESPNSAPACLLTFQPLIECLEKLLDVKRLLFIVLGSSLNVVSLPYVISRILIQDF